MVACVGKSEFARFVDSAQIALQHCETPRLCVPDRRREPQGNFPPGVASFVGFQTIVGVHDIWQGLNLAKRGQSQRFANPCFFDEMYPLTISGRFVHSGICGGWQLCRRIGSLGADGGRHCAASGASQRSVGANRVRQLAGSGGRSQRSLGAAGRAKCLVENGTWNLRFLGAGRAYLPAAGGECSLQSFGTAGRARSLAKEAKRSVRFLGARRAGHLA
mmetsp:Transcript_49493/g.138590  ORF Transcript_49493/g.138590 Transcript_49493/m.138590 type:complete len:218 (+) Transcript_49493:935-1588(+)